MSWSATMLRGPPCGLLQRLRFSIAAFSTQLRPRAACSCSCIPAVQEPCYLNFLCSTQRGCPCRMHIVQTALNFSD